METHGGAKGCNAPTLEMEWEAHDKDREVKREAERLSKEELSDLAQLFPFTGDVIKTPGKSRKKMTREEKRTHNKCHLGGKKKTATERLIQEQQADLGIQKWKKQENAERVIEHQGLLYRQWDPRDRPEEVINQLVLLCSYYLDKLRLHKMCLWMVTWDGNVKRNEF